MMSEYHYFNIKHFLNYIEGKSIIGEDFSERDKFILNALANQLNESSALFDSTHK